MYFDALTMACVADELRATILGGRVQQVLLPDRLSIGLEIYAQRQRHYLLASAHADLGGLLLASDKLRRGAERETGLLVLLRKYLRGAVLSALHQPAFERVLRLEFDHPEWGCTDLIAEVMGRHSNLILVGAGNRVLDAVKRVGPQRSTVRPLLPGQPYTPPPPQDKLSPADLTEYRLQQILAAHPPETQAWFALVRGLRGMSPLLAREITFRAQGQAHVTIATVARLAPLLSAIGDLLAPLQSGDWQPTVVWESDRPSVYAPYPLTHRGQPQSAASMSQAIEVFVAAAASDDPYAAAKRPLHEAIAAARSRLTARREALQASLDKAAEADRLRQAGEWILAYAHTMVPGQQELEADTGADEPLCILLDPEKSPAENAQAYFARYHKARRATADLPPRLEQAELALRDLDQLETDLELAASRPEVEEVRAALAEAGHVKAKRAPAVKGPRLSPLSLRSPDGFTVLIGRNSRQNDEVTFRQAERTDWWFHARGVPGAHVVVRSGGQGLPPATIQHAAELAAHFSRLQNEASVPVDYTQRRYVRRLPGAAPGLVTYSHEQTIYVTPRAPG
jgi:predicted ribosome quality control (RQC) complex YloA/Tae2 family protein